MSDLIFILALWIIFAFFGKDAVTAILYLIQDAEITARIRAYIEVRYSETKLEYLMNCPYCLSYWISLAVAAMYGFMCIYLQMHWLVSSVLTFFLYLTIVGQKIIELRSTEK